MANLIVVYGGKTFEHVWT